MPDQLPSSFIAVAEAASIRGANGRDPIASTRKWLFRWNKKHPFGDPLHVFRQPGTVHEPTFRQALSAAEKEREG